jgi:protein-S-isoprenylcysteine O-methyltransferase Ste14
MLKKVLPPPVFMLISLMGVVVFGFIYPLFKIITYPFNLSGIIFVILGAIIMGLAGKLFLKYKTTLNPNKKSKKLVVEGPYKFTRNPMYLGAFSVFFGIGLISGSLLSVLFSFLAPILINYIIIPFEERVMEKEFGKQYLKYKQQVNRWI